MQNGNESWSSGHAYEKFMGRWSILASRKFLERLAIPFNQSWLDVGCGTGAHLEMYQRYGGSLYGMDTSPTMLNYRC